MLDLLLGSPVENVIMMFAVEQRSRPQRGQVRSPVANLDGRRYAVPLGRGLLGLFVQPCLWKQED